MRLARGNGPVRAQCHHTAGCPNCPRLSVALWSDLPEADVAVLSAARQQYVFEPGEHLITQGQPCRGIYCIETGEAAVRKTDDAGNSFLLRFVGPEAAVGYKAFFRDQPHSCSVQALTSCQTCFIPAEVLRALMRRSTLLASRFLAHAARELEEADDSRLRQAFLPVRARLAHLLLHLRERHGTMEPDGTLVIALPLSRQDIASQLGTVPETVARTIRTLDSSGVARFDGRTVRIPDLDLLLDELESGGQ